MYKILHIPTGNFIWIRFKLFSTIEEVTDLTIDNWSSNTFGVYLGKRYLPSKALDTCSELYSEDKNFFISLIKDIRFLKFLALDIYNISWLEDVIEIPSEEEFEIIEVKDV